MSTQKNNITAKRLAKLLAQGEMIFHAKDLATLWNITNNNTLRTTLKRYCQNQLLYRIYKGFYSVIKPEKLDPAMLGAKAIHGYCYLSTESVLYPEGFISKKISTYTFAGPKSQRFSIGEHRYKSRQLSPRYLFNPEGVETKNGVKQANLYRAIADMLYFSPKYHFDREIDWEKVQAMQKKIGYPLTPTRYVDPQSR